MAWEVPTTCRSLEVRRTLETHWGRELIRESSALVVAKAPSVAAATHQSRAGHITIGVAEATRRGEPPLQSEHYTSPGPCAHEGLRQWKVQPGMTFRCSPVDSKECGA
jgi:hypothetical protein